MKDTRTQREWVVKQLKTNGFVTRNQALKTFISRLSAIIFELKDKHGFEFEGKFRENNTLFGTERDFVYTWKNPTEEIDLKTEFFFHWIDESNVETPMKVVAKTFNEACEVFLMQPPIFMFAIAEEVEDNTGSVYNVESNPKFGEFRTYSKIKKRSKNEQ